MTLVNFPRLPPATHTHLNKVGILKMKSLKLRAVKPPTQGHTASTGWSQDKVAYSVAPKQLAARLHSLTPNLHPVPSKSLRKISLQPPEITVDMSATQCHSDRKPWPTSQGGTAQLLYAWGSVHIIPSQ